VTAKRERMRLAKAELLLHLAMTTLRWQRCLDGTEPGCLPPSEWPDDDPHILLCRTYRLTTKDLVRICDQLGAELENRAERAGYAETWDHEKLTVGGAS
jgi:hypothetical protein